MADIDELDQLWREGLSSVAADMTPITDPTARVAKRVRRRRRAHTTRTAIAIAIAGLVIIVAVSIVRNPRRGDFATSSPVEVVRVEVLVGGQLTISFPGRAVSGQPPRVDLPHGVIRFEVRSPGGADRLVIDGIPEFVAALSSPPETVTDIVRMPPGRYLMHSTLSGHAEAGEKAILIVK